MKSSIYSPLACPFEQYGYSAIINTSTIPSITECNNLVTYASTQKPNLYYVQKDSQQYKDFIKRIEHNFQSDNQYKLSACLFCWGFLTPGQKKRHLEH